MLITKRKQPCLDNRVAPCNRIRIVSLLFTRVNAFVTATLTGAVCAVRACREPDGASPKCTRCVHKPLTRLQYTWHAQRPRLAGSLRVRGHCPGLMCKDRAARGRLEFETRPHHRRR